MYLQQTLEIEIPLWKKINKFLKKGLNIFGVQQT